MSAFGARVPLRVTATPMQSVMFWGEAGLNFLTAYVRGSAWNSGKSRKLD